MTKRKSDDFVTRARRFCPEYPRYRLPVTTYIERPYVPAPPANEGHLQTALGNWTEQVNTQRTRTGFQPIAHLAVAELIEPPIAA